MSPTMKSYFQEVQTATAILVSVWNAYVGQVLQKRSFLGWAFFLIQQKKEKQARKLAAYS